MLQSNYSLYLTGTTSLSLMSITSIRTVRNCSDLVLPVTDENIIIQIFTTAIGPGATISRPVPFLKQTTSAPNFSESWSASKLTL